MPALFVTIGCPASGKSTWAQSYSAVAIDTRVFSSDEYRKKLFGSENDQTNNEEVFKALYNDLEEWLKEGHNAVLDATNMVAKRRMAIIERYKNIPNIVFYADIFATPYQICLERDARRERRVGETVIKKMIQSFQMPFKYEGWKEIVIHQYFDKHYKTVEYEDLQKQMMAFKQDNPHHKYTLGEHSYRVAEILKEEPIMSAAALVHDVGKLYTKQFWEDGYAHYYGHANWSTYFLISEMDYRHKAIIDVLMEKYALANPQQKEIIDPDAMVCAQPKIEQTRNMILFYVQNHMYIRDYGESKTREKYIKLWGEKLYYNLVKFMLADNEATGTMEKEVILL